MELAAWRRLYLALLAAGLVALFVGAWWRLPGREIPIVGRLIYVPVLAFVAVAVAGLLWLRPHRTRYTLGVLCVLLAFVGFWLGSPAGGRWMGNLLNDPNYGPYGGLMFDFLFLVLLPVGWVLLGASVANWKVGVATYLVLGVALVLGTALTAGFGPPGYGPGQTPPWVPPYFLLGWPAVVLVVLGTFGRTFG